MRKFIFIIFNRVCGIIVNFLTYVHATFFLVLRLFIFVYLKTIKLSASMNINFYFESFDPPWFYYFPLLWITNDIISI